MAQLHMTIQINKNGFLLIELLIGLFLFGLLALSNQILITSLSSYIKTLHKKETALLQAQHKFESWLAYFPIEHDETVSVTNLDSELEKLTIQLSKNETIFVIRETIQ